MTCFEFIEIIVTKKYLSLSSSFLCTAVLIKTYASDPAGRPTVTLASQQVGAVRPGRTVRPY
ncbi:hypothetical protein BpHYR1_054011 [Brachionus plicatilis]|uniref:Uncharacterized protein n=1 Tax=Brachionus plicatilis TaxID=10195 RepID=A0A3M7PUB5_BRAPC|nr:hypothetical protein BpHYR1_054011 [Brachionus plicatilis]